MVESASRYRRPYTVGDASRDRGDSGCDIFMPQGSPVIAVDDGPILYIEGWNNKGKAHTPWTRNDRYPFDTPGAALQLLDHPVQYKGRIWTMAWYCHLSNGFTVIRDGIDKAIRVHRGQMIGRSGVGRGEPHLHFGLIDRRDQGPGHFLPGDQVYDWLQTTAVK